MKAKKKLTLLAAASLLGGLATGCVANNQSASSVSSEESVSESVDEGTMQISEDVYAIVSVKGKTLSYVAPYEEVDLDEYFEVQLDNDDIIHEFKVTCSDSNVEVNGHKIKAKAVGDYKIRLSVNGRNRYVTLSVKSEYNIELINFLKTFEDSDGLNYRIDLGTYSKYTKRFWYEDYTIIHNQNYAAAFNAKDPGELSDDGESNSFVIENLSDKNGYMGVFGEDGEPVFENGKIKISNYYIMGSMLMDGSSFKSQYDSITGEETLVGGASVAKTFLNYGLSNLVENYGYSEHAIYVLDLTDEYDENGNKGTDGVKDTLYVKVTIDGTGTNSSGEEISFNDAEYCTCRISQVGTASWPTLEKARTDESYIPKAIPCTEIGDAFSNVVSGANYTTTMSIYPVDDDGELIASADVVKYSSIYILTRNTEKITEVNTVSNSTNVEAKVYLGSSEEPAKKKAYWVDSDGKGYVGTYAPSEKEGEGPVITKDEDPEYARILEGKAMMADNVDQADISKAIWKKKSTNEGIVTFSGNIGDNNTTDGQTNGFFADLFDQMILHYDVEITNADKTKTTKTVGFGTYMTMDGALEYNSGETASYTVASSYESVAVNTTTNEISIKALIYLPYSNLEQPYVMCEYTISNIGTTTNDFSGYVASSSSSSTTGGESSSEGE